MGSTPRKYLPDFIVQVDDGQAEPLNLIVEIKGFRGEDAKDKANAMRAFWVPGVNNLAKFGRWSFAEFTAVFEIEAEFRKLIEEACATGSNLLWEKASALSDQLLTKRFGDQTQLLRIGRALWEQVQAEPRPAIRLSNIRAAAEQADCDMRDALAVVAALSSGDDRLLDLELSESAQKIGNVTRTELVTKLHAWLRDRTLSDRQWREWASNIEVRWVPVQVGADLK